MGQDSSGLAKNTCAANTKAAASSRDYRKKVCCYSSAKARKSVHRWSNSGDCRCSLVRKTARARRCYYAHRCFLPRADDRSSRGHAAKWNLGRFARGDHSMDAESSAPAHWTDDSSCQSLAARVRDQWRCLALPKYGHCQGAVRNYFPQRRSPTVSSLTVPRAAGSARARAAARSFRNLPAHYCPADSRTARWSSRCCARWSCQPGRSFQPRRSRVGLRNVRRYLLRSSCEPIHARQPEQEPCAP